MFRHLLKLTWKRKSRNLMLSLEILLAFAIVFAVAAFGLRYAQLYRMPLGFDGTDVWSVTVLAGDNGKNAFDEAVYDSLRRGLAELPEVRVVGFASFEPYAMSTISSDLRRDGASPQVHTELLDADDRLAEVLGLTLVEGRWFSPLDNGSAHRPTVINRRMAEAMFPGEHAVGKQFIDGEGPKTVETYRVVGVVDEYRAKGELAAPVNFAFTRLQPGKHDRDARTIVLKVNPGTTRAFERRLNARLKLIRNDWSFQIAPLSSARSLALKTRTVPLIVVGVIAGFMLLMVAFGLFGALWQNTTQRIPEIGLRRAIGASAADIYRQIVAEQFMLSSIAIVLGLALLVQLPLTGALGESLNWTVFAGAAALSMAVIYLLSLLCAVYPGWRASRLSPTEALHYE
ncbi:ABC transporter permease [Massilia sp. Leaf139]|uniref:ABC transporter permease n=1 Tax=Massilia sp. Leaf139 TaxID=1736272 RepID=UPI0007016766|nr:FtsX-like permease family protein [Massilia sp. Leaf139]KQQ96790.1 ABC transporter permease [Massilia sp. Leaf139]